MFFCSCSRVSVDSASVIWPGSAVRAAELDEEEVRIDVVSASDDALDDSRAAVPPRIGIGGWSILAEPAFAEPGAV